MKMLYDIYYHFNKNDKEIKDVDEKWRMLFLFMN